MIRKIMHRPQAVLGLAMMLLVFLVMLLAPVFAPNDPMQLNVAHSFAPPDAQYPLGTDELGRCILSRLIYGARASLSIALPTLLLLAVISTVVATLCAYIGGVLDRIFEVVSNIFMAFPPFLVAITLVGLFESKAASIVLSIVIAMWVWNARVVRTHVLRERNQPYVITCRMSGCSELRIVFRHIIPNILPHLLVLYSTGLSSIIIMISSYAFLGLGLGWKWLATLFAFFAAIATFGIGSMVQSNSVADALNHSFSIAPGITGIVLMGLTAAVIIGGVRSIGRVTALLVPVMIALYVLGALAVILMHITEIPGVLAMVVSSAFQPVAATGGFAGATVMMAIRLGVARGLFSNESGLGSAPIAAAAARTSQPVVQALISMTQTFIDTLVVCSMTGLVILVTGVWTSGKNGAPLTSYAFETGLPGELGGLIVTIGIILFAYSTILGWSYYGEKAIEYLLGNKAIIPYRWAFIISVGLGASMKLDLVWTLSDIFNALMAFPNLIGLIMLTPVVKTETLAYLRSLKKEPASEG